MNSRTFPLKWLALWVAMGASLAAAVVYLSLAPVSISLPSPYGDKLAHVALYATLMFWLLQIYDGRHRRVAIALALLALGCALEVIQGYTGYRSFEYADMAANAIGVAAGWLAAPPRMPNMLLRVENLRLGRSG